MSSPSPMSFRSNATATRSTPSPASQSTVTPNSLWSPSYGMTSEELISSTSSTPTNLNDSPLTSLLFPNSNEDTLPLVKEEILTRIAYPNGNVFVGEIDEHGQANGEGCILYPDGRLFEGKIEAGAPGKAGKYTFINGLTYVGELKQGGIIHGRGVCTYKNGSHYYGEFQDQKKHGSGVMIAESLNMFSGLYDKGAMQQGVLYGGKDHCYAGTFVENKLEGECLVETIRPNYRRVIAGNYKAGQKVGLFTFYKVWPEGRTVFTGSCVYSENEEPSEVWVADPNQITPPRPELLAILKNLRPIILIAKDALSHAVGPFSESTQKNIASFQKSLDVFLIK